MNIESLVAENRRRLEILYAPYDPINGTGSPLPRFPLKIIANWVIHLPESMRELELINDIASYGSLAGYVAANFGADNLEMKVLKLAGDINFHRKKHDFEYWAYTHIKIQDKETFQIIPFLLRKAQHKLLMSYEKQRLANLPIRTIVDKARQWGGSTLTQVYMMWIQQEHKDNWHIAVVAHLDDAAKHIRGMYVRAAKYFPEKSGTITLVPYERSSKNLYCREKGCILGVGSVENPDQFHSYNYAMIHLSEVGRWSETTKKSANELAQALRPTVPDVPYSMIVLESTANGRGNFFHREWVSAVNGESRYDPVFVAWFEIELYQREIEDYKEFIRLMDNHPKREYYWTLWAKGATLEGISWYMHTQLAENYSDIQMWRQFPSDAEESFSATGRRVFSPLVLANARMNCVPPIYKGQLFAKGQKGRDAFVDITFQDTGNGELWVWSPPDTTTQVSNRYVVIADIGGKTDLADFSTIRVIDRYYLMEAGSPESVATWRGHMDQDLFAWVCAQVAYWYNKALLVIESNSLRKELADSEGSHFLTILNEIADYYDNLFTRTNPEKIRQGVPVQWGFHTNVQTKPLVINSLNAAWRDENFIERDIRVLDEADQFEFHTDGTMGAVEGTHDDLLMATAIGVWCSESYMDPPRIIIPPPKKTYKPKRTEATL